MGDIIARSSGRSAVMILMPTAFAERLGASIEGRLAIAYGQAPHTITLARARDRDTHCITAFGRGRRFGINLRVAFIPGAELPSDPVVLPHRWDDAVLAIEWTPLIPRKNSVFLLPSWFPWPIL